MTRPSKYILRPCVGCSRLNASAKSGHCCGRCHHARKHDYELVTHTDACDRRWAERAGLEAGDRTPVDISNRHGAYFPKERTQ
jgi:hypothetical protein